MENQGGLSDIESEELERLRERNAELEALAARRGHLHDKQNDGEGTVDLLHQSEETIRSIVESAPTGVHFYRLEDDDQLIFTGGNPAADLILKVDNSQFIGKEGRICPGLFLG